MHASDLPEIRHLLLFRTISDANFELLVRHAYAQTFPAGLELVRQGDPADFLHIVMQGMVELYASWAERQCTMAIVRPVGSFILAACIKDAPYLMSARTIERSRVILIPAADLRVAFRNDGEFALSVITELAGAYRSVVRHAKGLKLRTSRERIASYLLGQVQRAGDVSSFVLPIEKRHLASYLGMTAENLSRALRSLEPDGVTLKGARVIVTDRARLTRLARPDPLLDGPDPENLAADASLPGPRIDLPAA